MIAVIRRLLQRWVFDSRYPHSLAHRLRQRRWNLFRKLCSLPSDALLVDLGGLPDDGFAGFWPGPTLRVNIQRHSPRRPRDLAVVADAQALPFRDQALSVVFCNSLLEHVGPWQDQQKAAREIRRVAQRYFVQVPDRHAPIEPHYLLPFFQFLPDAAQRRVHHWLPIGFIPRGGWLKVWLLSARELQTLFPAARIVRERFLGLPKSCYAVQSSATMPESRASRSSSHSPHGNPG